MTDLSTIAEAIRARVLIMRETPDALEWMVQGVACEIVKVHDGWRTRVTHAGREVRNRLRDSE